MSTSYKDIDYRIRSAKHVERAIFVDTFKNIPFCPITDYQYIGLGSIFFVDFRLFHKALGIKKMTSIEQTDGRDGLRFKYNKPFSCLELKVGPTSTELPTLDFTDPTIAWMDYDSKLDANILLDVRLLANKMKNGSFLAVTVNCRQLKLEAEQENKDRKDLEILAEAVGEEKLPAGIKVGELDPMGTRLVYHKLIVNEINSMLMTRNVSLGSTEKLIFQQVFFLRYADGADMMTIGGFLLNTQGQETFTESDYANQAYFSMTEESIPIEIPKLTMKEILVLETLVPDNDIGNIEKSVPEDFPFQQIPPGQIERYLKSYRYLPNYVSAEIN